MVEDLRVVLACPDCPPEVERGCPRCGGWGTILVEPHGQKDITQGEAAPLPPKPKPR